MASKIAVGFIGSFNSFEPYCDRNKRHTNYHCRSEPFGKPTMSLQKWLDRLNTKVLKLLSSFKDSSDTVAKPEDFTLEESKLIIGKLASEFDRITKGGKSFLLAKTTGDESCLKDQQSYILQWAEELRQSTRKTEGRNIACSPTDIKTENEEVSDPHSKDRMEQKTDSSHSDKELHLSNANKVLSEWVQSLGNIEQESMSLSDGDCVVLGDLKKLWKKGKLQSILPVMDFYVWILLREHTQQGSIAKHWLRDNHRFRNRVALSYIPESVWEWIFKASVQVTLDPSTANPCLKLSSNRKGVKMDKIIESLNNPFNGYNRSKTKYDGWWCVLGAEGYDSGRHYWEVNISGKQEWRIGVVKESASRNGFTTLDTTAGYWTLRLQLGRLLAMTSPVTKLERCAPSRLGVLLDIEEGHVSFYDAEERCHIYTFDVNFDHMGKVYPVFGTIET